MNSNRVRIQLIDKNVGYLDVKAGTDFPITYGVADVRDLTKRSGTFSKSITLAATNNNNILLNNYFDLNIVAGTFNSNKLQKCIVLQDNIPIVENAVLQLVSINKVQNTINTDEQITYTVLVKESTIDFYTKLGQKKLTDLTFPAQNHTYTADNIAASFNHSYTDLYKYVLPFSTGNDNIYYLNEFHPGIYAIAYWNKIFQSNGFSYEWPEQMSETVQFQKLIVPYNGDTAELTAPLVQQNSVSATRTTLTKTTAPTDGTGGVISGPNPGPFGSGQNYVFDVINNEVSDPSNSYNPSNGRYTQQLYINPGTGLNMSFTFEYDIFVVNNSGSNAQLVKSNPASPFNNGGMTIYSRLSYHKNGNTTQPASQYFAFNNPNSPIPGVGSSAYSIAPGAVYTPGTTLLASNTKTITGPQPNNFNAGDYLNTAFSVFTSQSSSGTGADVKWRNGSTVGSALADVKIQVVFKNITYSIVPTINSVSYLSTIDIRSYIPKDIQQVDFIKAFVQMYNLFIDIDPNEPNKLIIKSRDKYYDDGKLVDWSKKLTKNQQQDKNPSLSADQKKRLILTYKQDKDTPNTEYEAATNEIYGQQEFTYDNEFIKEEEKKEILFSPTPVAATPFGAIVPIINGFAPKTNIRILFDGGNYPCDEWKISNDSSQTIIKLMNIYPHISHFDKPVNPNFDINFGVCDKYFYNTLGNITNNNLYNYHWRRTLNQINAGHMITALFDLDAYDIQKMELSDKIRIDNAYYNINAIVDYNPTETSPTKVELISIDNELEFVPFKTRPFINTSGSVDSVISGPIKGPGTGRITSGTLANTPGIFVSQPNNNIGSVKGAVVLGQMNSVFGDGGFVSGDKNSVNEKALVLGDNSQVDSTALVLGDNAYVPAGLKNVLILGDDVTAAESNTLYTKNIQVDNINGVPATSIIAPDLATVLVNGNITGGSNIVMTSGDMITGDGSYSGYTTTLNIIDPGFIVTSLDMISTNYLGVTPGDTYIQSQQVAGTLSFTGENRINPNRTALTTVMYDINTSESNVTGIINDSDVSTIFARYLDASFVDSVYRFKTKPVDGFSFNFNTDFGDPTTDIEILAIKQDNIMIGYVPVTDNTNVKVLARNAISGNIEEVDISSFSGSTPPLASVLGVGNTTSAHNIIVSINDIIANPTSSSIINFGTTSTPNFLSLKSIVGVNSTSVNLIPTSVELVAENATSSTYHNLNASPSRIELKSDTGTNFTFTGPTMNIANIPTLNNTATQVLVRNSGTGNVEYRSATTLGVQKYVVTMNLAAGNNTVTHSLGNADILFQLYDSSGVSFLPEQVSNLTTTTCNIRVATAMMNVRVVITA